LTATSSQYDVIVIGARCAGAATARLLAAAGHDVLLIDRTNVANDPLSTHGIARGGVVQLARWGLLQGVLDTGAPAVREVSFTLDHDEKVRRVSNRAGVDLLFAPRRFVLDQLLVDHARAAGATVEMGVAVTGLVRNDQGRVCGINGRLADGSDVEVTARHVIGADGLRSTVASSARARVIDGFKRDVALFYAYVDGVDWRRFEFHLSAGAFAGVFPSHSSQACVWLTRPTPLLADIRQAGRRRTHGFGAALHQVAPELAARVSAGRIVSPIRGWIAPPSYLKQAFGNGWSLVGDAGYFRDPITGHGITDAFRDAEILALALDVALREPRLERDALMHYAAVRDTALSETFELTRKLTRFPEPTRFVELQIQLSEALDREAQMLASLPTPVGARAVSTA
jgi:flavin-dependent dehydrogenase